MATAHATNFIEQQTANDHVVVGIVDDISAARYQTGSGDSSPRSTASQRPESRVPSPSSRCT
jgi:hypothetical protein